MRVALIAESYLPHMNGVTNSVLHVLRHLAENGHEALVIAPRSAGAEPDVGARTALLTSLPFPSYPQVRVVFARVARIAGILREFGPDVVHLASPFVLGWQGVLAADVLRIPSVAIYQTDVVAYTERYGLPRATSLAAAHVGRLHRRATLTLAPSAASVAQLERLGVDRVRRWGRGVDGDLFHPDRRDEAWRRAVAPGERIVGYVGRLAPEKQVEDLAVLQELPGTRLVIVGDGPSRPALEQAMPRALFLGHLSGAALAGALASFDVFVHPGESETFGQTIQEAHASGVPVVATGRGGPVDLVRSSVDGWLYRPGDLGDLRDRVSDLLGDDAKRAAFAAASRAAVAGRTWRALCAELVDRYREACALRPLDDALLVRGGTRPEPNPPAPAVGLTSYVALGDSLTEGLCDASRMPHGAYRGWADRLAGLLAQTSRGAGPFRYANLAVRSRRVRDLTLTQVPRALELRPQLVSILMGHNDLVGHRADPIALAAELERNVALLRRAGCEVLLLTLFLPRRRASALFARRIAVYNSQLRRIARAHGCRMLDVEALAAIRDPDMWADDRVHLRSRGHRLIAYRAAEVLGVPDAEALGDLDAALHDDEPHPAGWLRRDALPWVWRRLRGRTAGDGLAAKHDGYVELPRPGTAHRTRA
ncbi:GDSL-type esterase/lipase family protein [Microbacterium sp. SORGH_AS_0888]|uniref:GDSL-type esterase/lipase family protein n=1 Tax=Microbacterium sp. SORGH_AS_0888 TaxID=3041791 RepID=UPI00277E7584|nr:GDSL-type esterase/lipase family protein [Microbacterium sp. SORGH_AS_0888]MDQ1129112.1 phosphatidylinositol alpha 1,6-mannosyltransferase [Microbacterium sp. SORGH_AS_0888]